MLGARRTGVDAGCLNTPSLAPGSVMEHVAADGTGRAE